MKRIADMNVKLLCCRAPPILPSALKAPRKSIKGQIRNMHPSCRLGTLKKLSNAGVEYVESILGCFCQVESSIACFVPFSVV
jgi:hypothetical protein